MKISIKIDDSLLSQAKEMTGITDVSELANVGLEALIQVETNRRLLKAQYSAGPDQFPEPTE